MNAVEVLIGGGALAYLVITGLVAWFRDKVADVEFLLADGLAAIDCERWDAEVNQ